MLHWIICSKKEYWKDLERSKISHPHERQKLVHAGVTSVLFSLIVKFQDLTSFCSKLTEILIFFNSYIHWIKYWARSKGFHPHEKQKLVQAGAPSVHLFSIGKLHDLRSSCWKLIEILILSNPYMDWIQYVKRSKLFRLHERQKLVHAGPPSVLYLSVPKLQNFTSSCLKIIEILIFLKCYTGLSVPKTRILEIFGKK